MSAYIPIYGLTPFRLVNRMLAVKLLFENPAERRGGELRVVIELEEAK